VPLAALEALSPAFGPDVAQLWDFRAAVDRRNVAGGTGTESVRAQLAAARQLLAAA